MNEDIGDILQVVKEGSVIPITDFFTTFDDFLAAKEDEDLTYAKELIEKLIPMAKKVLLVNSIIEFYKLVYDQYLSETDSGDLDMKVVKVYRCAERGDLEGALEKARVLKKNIDQFLQIKQDTNSHLEETKEDVADSSLLSNKKVENDYSVDGFENDARGQCPPDFPEDDDGIRILKILLQISGIGKSKARKIVESGIADIKQLEQADINSFLSIDGIGMATATDIIETLDAYRKEDGSLCICLICGAPVIANSNTCTNCGSLYDEGKENIYQCNNCGSHISSDVDICSRCGFYIDEGEDSCEVHEPTRGPSIQEVEEELQDYVSKKKSQKPSKTHDTYICDNCGKISNISNVSCTFCGNPCYEEEHTIVPEKSGDESKKELCLCGVCGSLKTTGTERCSICGSITSKTSLVKAEDIDIEDEEWNKQIFICDACGTIVDEMQERCTLCNSYLEYARREILKTELTVGDTSSDPSKIHLDEVNREGVVLCSNCGASKLSDLDNCYICTDPVEDDGIVDIRQTTKSVSTVTEDRNIGMSKKESINSDSSYKDMSEYVGVIGERRQSEELSEYPFMINQYLAELQGMEITKLNNEDKIILLEKLNEVIELLEKDDLVGAFEITKKLMRFVNRLFDLSTDSK